MNIWLDDFAIACLSWQQSVPIQSKTGQVLPTRRERIGKGERGEKGKFVNDFAIFANILAHGPKTDRLPTCSARLILCSRRCTEFFAVARQLHSLASFLIRTPRERHRTFVWTSTSYFLALLVSCGEFHKTREAFALLLE